MQTMSLGRNALRSLLMLMIISVSLITLTNHARTSHTGQAYSALDVYDTICEHYNSTSKSPCKQFEVAACPFAKNLQTGKWNPHFKIFCLTEQDFWIQGIVGTVTGIEKYVTGYKYGSGKVDQVVTRDRCVVVDSNILKFLFK